MATNPSSQINYNYIIVGGGIYGCLVSWILSKQNKNHKILLLESNRIASGASGGLGQRGVRASGRHISELPLMSIAYKLWPKIMQQLNLNDNHYKQIGGLTLTENINMVKNSDKLSEIASKQNKYGVKTEVITNKHILKSMEPTLSSSVVGAIYCPYDGVGSHDKTTKTVAKYAQNNGVIIKEYCTVKTLEKSGKKWKIITNSNDYYYATNSVFLLCNCGVKTLLKDSLNMEFPQIQEMLPQIVIINGKMFRNKINHLIGHFERTLAMKTVLTSSDKDLMISGGYLGKLNSETGEYEPVRKNVIANIKQAKETFHGLNIDEYDDRNIIAKTDRLESICTADDIPIIDRISIDDDSCDIFYGFGWSGHGWAISPTISELLVKWSETKQCPSLLKPFSFERFNKKKNGSTECVSSCCRSKL